MNKEFICMEEDVITTQKKIKTWISTGYQIEIISQSSFGVFDNPQFGHFDRSIVVTSLWRWKN